MPFVRVRGLSMIPTLQPGDLLWAGAFGSRPRRGDLVLLQRADHPGPFVKRVIGLPGEQVELRQARVLIDRTVVPEPYVSNAGTAEPLHDETWRLGPDEFIVLGDARDDSLDSRRFGPVKRSALLAHVTRILWPWLRRRQF